MRKQLTSVFMSLAALVALGVGQAQAQVVGAIEADIPFAFHAGNARFPAGTYRIEAIDRSQLPNVMEIRSRDGHQAAVFLAQAAQAQTAPPATELIFDKYGDQYFLSKLFEEGSRAGSEIEESHYEKTTKKDGTKAEQHRVPGRHASSHQR